MGHNLGVLHKLTVPRKMKLEAKVARSVVFDNVEDDVVEVHDDDDNDDN